MNNDIKIEALKFTGEHIDEPSELLIQVVEDGASIGFLPYAKSANGELYATIFYYKILNNRL